MLARPRAVIGIQKEQIMLINDSDALMRVTSPLNLLNRMRDRTTKGSKSMSLFVPSSDVKVIQEQITSTKLVNPFAPSSLSSISSSIPPASASVTALSPINDNVEEVKLDNLLDNADNKIKLSHAHNKALETLVNAVDMMQMKLDDIKPDKLPSVITATAKVVDGIRRERNEAAKAASGKAVHLHFYTPIPKQIQDYDVIEVG